MYYKIASIQLNNERKSGFAGDIFIAQPDTQKEALAGKLFVLAEIQSSGSDAGKILEFLIGNLNYNYYQNEKVILRERIDTITLESVFESALAKTNKDLAEFIAQEKIKISPYAFNVAICVLYKNEIYFSALGKNKILLVYKEKAAHKPKDREDQEEEKSEYKITDIGKAPEGEALNINNLFSSVVSGKIPVGGYFLAVNEALSEYLSHKQMTKIVTKLSPAGAAEQIRNLLEQINSYVSFLGVIIKNTVSPAATEESLAGRLEEETETESYRPEITRTEEKTEAIMTPSGIVSLKKWTKALGGKIKPAKPAALPAKTTIGKKMFLLKEKIFFKKRAGLVSLDNLGRLLRKAGQVIGALPAFIFKFFARGPGQPAEPEMAGLPPDAGEEKTPFFSGLKIKIIFTAALILIIVFAVNIYLTGQKNKAEEALRKFNTLISTIEKNQGKIDSDFIYGNKTEIKDLFGQDKDLLAQIPAAEIAKREDVKALFDRQAQQLERIRGVTKISGLKKIADFSNLTAAADPQNLLLADNRLLAGDGKNNAVFKIDLKQNTVTAAYLNDASSSIFSYPTAGQNGNIYYLNGGSILQIDQTDKPSSLTISLPSTMENIGGLYAYSDKLYVLDRSLGQIFRYSWSADGFVNQAKWLNEKTDLSAAAGIFIDGNIYILYRNGQIAQYLKGKKQDLSLETADPPLTNTARLIATPDYFYVLEPAAKRLVLWNNKGAYLAQYIFTDLNDIKDFAVNDQDKQIYLLSGGSVYQMAIPVIK